NLVISMSMLVAWVIPDVPKNISEQLKKEKTLLVDVFLNEEKEKLQLIQSLTAGRAADVGSDLAASSANQTQAGPSRRVPDLHGSSHPTPSRKLQPVHPPDVHVSPKRHHPTHGRVREVGRKKI
ncbi:hypothetical protein M9458_009974, partial [Cirrhinus mrigala]